MSNIKSYKLIIFLILVTVVNEPAIAAKKKIAILNTESSVSVSDKIKAQVQSDIERFLVNSGKFDIVDRAKLKSLSDEILLSEDGLVNSDSAIHYGNFTGAEYLLFPKIVSSWSTSATRDVPYSGGEAEVTVSSGFAIELKLIVTSTSEIKVAQKVSAQLSATELESSGQAPSTETALRGVIRKASSKAGIAVVSALYPIKVAHISQVSGLVTLNAGKKRLKKGKILKVFSVGESIIDPDTGEAFASDEQQIGKIKVLEVHDKFSKAKVIKGNVIVSAVCR